MRSNCIAQALRLFRKALREGKEPYLVLRPSRMRGGVLHMLYGEHDPVTDQVRVVSFKPTNPVDLPWWQLPLFFEGEMRDGDMPTQEKP